MHTIQATVNQKLLAKANRLFTGSLDGRVVELLQNARRAGATQVTITNTDGRVTVCDNGQGIGEEDWPTLLDLGGSGWSEELDACEDPCGVGVFCLAPRTVTIRSGGKRATIEERGWRGRPVEIQDDPAPIVGTSITFADEPWALDEVEPHAVFSGMEVIVDGIACARQHFLTDAAVRLPQLGCRIEVRDVIDLGEWHWPRGPHDGHRHNAMVNFHGHVVSFHFDRVGESELRYLVDLTGDPTGIRLMLPARTCLVENDGLAELRDAMECSGFEYIARRGQHKLAYKDYVRACELGIELPEAEPMFQYGLLFGDSPEPIAIPVPEGHPLSACYRFNWDAAGRHEGDAANAHLLAALGSFEKPFVPVFFHSRYRGYSWADLPAIEDVSLTVGESTHEEPIGIGTMTCVKSLVITARTSDGEVFTGSVCMAMDPDCDDRVYATPNAEDVVSTTDVWNLLGGCWDEGDTYETQRDWFSVELDRFWANCAGPDEWTRRRIMQTLDTIRPAWKRVEVLRSGHITIHFKNGSRKQLDPPVGEPT